MDRCLVINKDNVVINTILWNGITKWTPPIDCDVVRSETGNIGWIYDKETMTCMDPSVKPEIVSENATDNIY